MIAYVLIIEKNQDEAADQSRVLQEEGFIVNTVRDGAEALESIISGGVRPDLLIMGNSLPDMSGVGLLRRLKDRGLFVPSIMVTGTGNETVAVEAMKLGAMDYLVKGEDTLKRLPGICREVLEKSRLEIENIRLIQELKSVNSRLTAANKKLEELSRMDDLTKIFNRRYLLEQLEQEILRAKRYSHPLSFAIIDLDDFKKINDDHGHLVGDEVLSEFSLVLSEHLRRTDILGRYGGEEFGIIFTSTPLDKAVEACNELRQVMGKFRFGSSGSSVTMSIGVSRLEETMLMQELMETADRNMYIGKQRGKNQVVSIQKEEE